MIIYDTRRPFRRPLSPSQIQTKSNWITITDSEFSGDLCIENSRMALIFRRAAPGPELYYKLARQYLPGFNFHPLPPDDNSLPPEQSCEIKNISPNQITIEATCTPDPNQTITLLYMIRPYRASVEIHPGPNARRLALQSSTQYTIVPDLYADDILINPATRTGRLFLPEDNGFFVQLKDNGNAILVCNWLADDSDSEIELNLSRRSRSGSNTQTIIDLTNKSKVYLSLLATPGIWHQTHTSQLNIYNQIPLNWTVPFSAGWRADYRRSDRRASGLTDSFWNAVKLPNGTFMSAPGLMEMNIIDGQYVISGPQEIKRLVRRSVVNEYIGNGWWPFLGWFMQPFYTEASRAYIKLPKYDQLTSARYSGPIVIYPLMDEIMDDPTALTVESVLMDTLGPAYLEILDLNDLNKRPLEDYYPPTCFTTEYCENIFTSFQEIPRRRHIVSMLEQMKLFVSYTRDRIDTYHDWQLDIEELYDEARADDDPNLAPAVETLNQTSRLLTRRYRQEESSMKTPEHAARLADQIIDMIDNPSFSKITRTKQTGARLRNIGDTQDELLGELRDTLKIVRQRAGLLHTTETDPHVRQFLRTVRSRTQSVLRISYDMEGK